MNKLWAPWRFKFIQSKKPKKCIFCEGIKSKNKSYIIIKNKYSFAMLNKYPYNNGHVLIAPLRHKKDIAELKKEEILDIFKTLDFAKAILKKILKPQGFNIGINISHIAGAGITGHLHIHVVPRWQGDTNFMPIIYNTKIISQSLDDLYKKLKKIPKQYVKTNRHKRIRR